MKPFKPLVLGILLFSASAFGAIGGPPVDTPPAPPPVRPPSADPSPVPPGPPAEAGPDRQAVRGQVDALIHSFTSEKRKATLGMIHEAIALSISYGAPAYNLGDRSGCFHFYADTADALAEAFAADDSATDAARVALADLKAARERTRHERSSDRNAWSMRYAFDKTQIAIETQVVSTQGLVRLGSDNFTASHFPEAQDAFASATRSLYELEGQPPEQIPVECRFAPLALANALFAQHDYKAASAAVLVGLHYMPEFPSVTIDLRSLHHDPAEYEAMMDDLEAKANQAPDDAATQFLLGYEYYFTGKKGAARKRFEQTLKLDPGHAGAKLFLDFKPPDQKPDEPVKPGTPPVRDRA
jgi:tetratricopeptide (TPR) repeat protein